MVVSKTQRLTREALIINGTNPSCNCADSPGDGIASASEDTLVANLEAFKKQRGRGGSRFCLISPRSGDSIDTEISVTAGRFSSASVMSVSNLFSVIYSVPGPSTC